MRSERSPNIWFRLRHAKKLLKPMSDYLAAQTAISFDFDAILEVLTKDDQKLALASSGAVILNRPGKIRATRAGGHADIEMLFDGETLTLSGNDANLYTQISVPGTIDNFVDLLRDKYHMLLPAEDLLMSNSYDELMADATDVWTSKARAPCRINFKKGTAQ
jgi:hypothetical protein